MEYLGLCNISLLKRIWYCLLFLKDSVVNRNRMRHMYRIRFSKLLNLFIHKAMWLETIEHNKYTPDKLIILETQRIIELIREVGKYHFMWMLCYRKQSN